MRDDNVIFGKQIRTMVFVAFVLAAASSSLVIVFPASATYCSPAEQYACCDDALSNCWWYVKAQQQSFSASPIGVYAKMTIERPVLASYRDHSLAEIGIGNVHSDDSFDAIEVGWSVIPGVYGDEEARLFAFSTRGVQDPVCWTHPEQCGWHAEPNATHHLGEYLQAWPGPPGPLMQFGILYNIDHNWWINFGNEWIGYFDGSWWNGQFTNGNILKWYGEVEGNLSSGDCTAMGNGRYSSTSGAAQIDDMGWIGLNTHGQMQHFQALAERKTSHDQQMYSNPSLYSMANFTGHSFTYGGPGGYVDRFGVTTTCSPPQ